MPGELILMVEGKPKNLKLIRDVLQFRGYVTLISPARLTGYCVPQ